MCSIQQNEFFFSVHNRRKKRLVNLKWKYVIEEARGGSAVGEWLLLTREQLQTLEW